MICMCRPAVAIGVQVPCREPLSQAVGLCAAFNSSIFKGVHHVGLLCKKLETSMEFYINILGTLSTRGLQ